MTLNASGPISLAGVVAGQSIALELGLGATSTISFQTALVRSLSGTGSGTIVTMPADFYSKTFIPTWSTPSGSLGSVYTTNSFSSSVNAANALSYSVVTGALPSGLSLNASTGAITGTVNSGAVPNYTSQTISFTIRAFASGGSADRAFSIFVQSATVPSWNTASGSIGSGYTQQGVSYSVNATGASSYSVVGGALPSGLGLNTSNGVISGTISAGTVGDYSSGTFSFTIRATSPTGITSDRGFSIFVQSRYVGISCFSASEDQVIGGSAPGGFVFNRVDFSSYGTPGGSCGAFTIGGCNSAASNAYNPTPTASFSTTASNGVWGDPCNGTEKYMYIQMTYGPF
jgi:hypothetical protein